MAILLALNAPAARASEIEAIIPPGQDDLVAEMLGRGAALPGGCKFDTALIAGFIRARYLCGGEPVVFMLRHRDLYGSSRKTEKFGLKLESGTPPAGLEDALLALVRAREPAFVWLEAPSFRLWRRVVHVNAWLFVLSATAVLAWYGTRAQRRMLIADRDQVMAIIGLTALAGGLRFLAAANLLDHGGIPYTRMLHGYEGYSATAEVFALLSVFTPVDIEHAILFDRIVGTLTIPLVYILCRILDAGTKPFPLVAAFLFTVYPLHILFSASDALPTFSQFLAVCSYVFLAGGMRFRERPMIAALHYFAGCAGLALLSQARPEHVLFVLPAAIGLIANRGSWRVGQLAVCGAMFGALTLFYGWQAVEASLSYPSRSQFWASLEMLVTHIVLNPLFAIPVFLVGDVFLWIKKGWRWLLVSLLPWLVGLALTGSKALDGHHAARLFGNWLIILIPIAAYGFALMLMAPQRWLRTIAAMVLLYCGALPLLARDCLAAQYLEMVEHARFKSVLHEVSAAKWVIVPDDTIANQSGSTLEAINKYQLLLEADPNAADHIEIVGLAEFLQGTSRANCAAEGCVFFSGVPCVQPQVYARISALCRELLRTHRTTVLSDAVTTAPPFIDCSIYTGAMRRRFCAPATKPRHLTLYRVDD